MRIQAEKWGGVFWLAVLVLTLPGCAGYHPAVLPAAGTDIPRNDEPLVLHVGSKVRFSLADGTAVSGEITRVTPTEFAIGKVGNYGYEERIFLIKDVRDLEAQKMTTAGSVLANTTSVLVVGFIALVVYVGMTFEWSSN